MCKEIVLDWFCETGCISLNKHTSKNWAAERICCLFLFVYTFTLLRCFLHNLLFYFEYCFSKQTTIASLITFCKDVTYFLPQDLKYAAISFILPILFVHACYIVAAMTTSFLYGSYGRPQNKSVPSSSWDLRVQSLHLPLMGLTRRFLLLKNLVSLLDFAHTKDE